MQRASDRAVVAVFGIANHGGACQPGGPALAPQRQGQPPLLLEAQAGGDPGGSTSSGIVGPSDIEGTYTAGQASVAVAGGEKVAELKNSKGVVLKVKGKQVGLELALDLSGMEVKLKK